MITVIRQLRPYLPWLVPMAVLAGLSAIAETVALVSIVPLAKVVADGEDDFSGTIGPLDLELTIDQLLLMSAVAVILALLFNLGTAIGTAKIQSTYLYRERVGLWDRYLDATWERQSGEREGRLQAHSNFVSAGSRGLVQLTLLTVAFVSVLVMVGAAFFINPISTLIMIGLGATVVAILIPINRLLKHLSRQTSRHQTDLNETISEVSSHTLSFRIFGTLWAARHQLEQNTDRVRALQLRSSTISGLVTPCYRALGLMVVLALLFIGSRQTDLDVAGFGAIALLLLRSLGYGQRLQTGVGNIVAVVGPLEELERSRLDFEAAKQRYGSSELAPIHQVRLDGVCYAYSGEDQPAVRGIDLDLERGEVMGLAGPSGSGKTTLSQILVRLRRPTSGHYVVNGVDADEYTPESWTSQVTLVPQAPALFHGTIRDNITVFRTHVDDRAIADAAVAAGIHETIETLPLGYDTPVGATLRNLSGGQIQRIGIARALAGRPSLLVLDEPTSALDVATEGLIQETLERIRGEITIVIIAHRLSTLAICDRVVELRDGRIAQSGTTDEILPGLETAHLS